MFMKIKYTANRNLKTVKVRCNANNVVYLAILASLNIIEFYKDKQLEKTYVVILTYYFGKPLLNNIIKLNLTNMDRGISNSRSARVSNSRKSLLIANTCKGVMLIDSSMHSLTPYKLLYKIELN